MAIVVETGKRKAICVKRWWGLREKPLLITLVVMVIGERTYLSHTKPYARIGKAGFP